MKKMLILLSLFVVTTALARGNNTTDGCVTSYNADTDYFPEKLSFSYAQGVEVEYFHNYKVVRTLEPYPDASEAVQYVLVQCGTPIPDPRQFAEGTQIIQVPTGNIITMSTTQLPHLNSLGLLDNLIGVDSISYVNTPEVIARFEEGKLIEVGGSTSVNVELVLDAEPDIVMSYGYQAEDAPQILMNAGVFTAINSSWLEPTLLARTEWLKFTALFYNEEARATQIFDNIVSEYEALSNLTTSIPESERVNVLWNAYSSYSDAWSIPGQQTWVGSLLADAGVNYVLQDSAPERSEQVSFEVVYDEGFDAPLWVANAFGVNTLDDLLAQDARYEDFAAFQTEQVYSNNARVNANGGNDFYETGTTNPQLLLADLIYLFYPELLPEHELVFYKKLD